jgi:predicted DNA-binding transcriptional regulator AlpA
MNKELLTISQVQEILQVSRSKVYKFISSEKNPLKVIYLSDRAPRIKQSDLADWIKNQDEMNQ